MNEFFQQPKIEGQAKTEVKSNHENHSALSNFRSVEVYNSNILFGGMILFLVAWAVFDAKDQIKTPNSSSKIDKVSTLRGIIDNSNVFTDLTDQEKADLHNAINGRSVAESIVIINGGKDEVINSLRTNRMEKFGINFER